MPAEYVFIAAAFVRLRVHIVRGLQALFVPTRWAGQGPMRVGRARVQPHVFCFIWLIKG